jgi:putative addiction module component (TIGR02574 family)
MTISLQSLGWDRLTLDEKLALVGQLWDEIVASVPPGGLLSDAQREELHRRVADAHARPEDAVAWEDVLSATLKRFS